MTDISWCTIKSNDDGQCACPKCSLFREIHCIDTVLLNLHAAHL